MSIPDAGELMGSIIGAAKGVIDEDMPAISGFAEAQLSDLAELGIVVAKGIAPGGWIDDPEDMKVWFKSIRAQVRDFVHTLAALVTLMIEKVLNAIIGVFTEVFSGALGAVLPIPI